MFSPFDSARFTAYACSPSMLKGTHWKTRAIIIIGQIVCPYENSFDSASVHAGAFFWSKCGRLNHRKGLSPRKFAIDNGVHRKSAVTKNVF